MDFLALDVETANADFASICQIGIVSFADGAPEGSWQSLVNPEDYFDPVNVSIHRINESSVKDAPTFQQLFETLKERLTGNIVAIHTPFDRAAVSRAVEKHHLPRIECSWLDTARVARRTWQEISERGYGLANVARKLGLTFVHHNAEEDARTAGLILARAIQETGMTAALWLQRVNRPINPSQSSPSKAMDGNPEGPLFGEVVVFTGSLAITRREAAEMAAKAGCRVGTSVTKETTLLIVGEQDIQKLAGHEKSSKHRKAEILMSAGEQIRILQESDFRRLVAIADTP